MRRSGVDAPWLTALVLFERATGLGREEVLAHPDAMVSRAQLHVFQALVERRCHREPLAYILGYRDFYGRRFSVDRSALIPRPETEGLVSLALDCITRLRAERSMDAGAAINRPFDVLDVGTGCGSIAVTILASRSDCRVVATDVDLQCLRLARSNAVTHEVAERLELVACDVVDGLALQSPLIVANLPYVPTNEIDQLEPEVAEFEPRRALDGGADGTAVIQSLLTALPRVMEPGGTALMEFGDGQSPRLRDAARFILPSWPIRTECDASGTERYLLVDRPSAGG